MSSVSKADQYSRCSSEEPFLQHQGHLCRNNVSITEKRYRRLTIVLGAACALFMAACVVLSTKIGQDCIATDQNSQVYSPVQDLIRYKNVVFTSGFGRERTAYQGPPSPERNALWDDLYGFGVSRIPRSSAAKLVNKTVPIPGEPGQYIVELNVFHQLHCLNMLRKRLYSKIDYPPDHESMGIEHLEHCYDALRQSLMCSVDVTPLPWRWVDDIQEAKEVAQVAHTCRDFDVIRSWAKSHAVDSFDTKTFVPDDLQD